MANKVKYGLSQCYYAKITTAADGTVTYGTPVALPGAVNLSLSAEGDRNVFYADNIAYWQSWSNNGYSGSLELALIPDSFKTDILGYATGTNGIMVEKADVQPEEFALLCQFEGDESARRHVLYRCQPGRPDVASATVGESIEPQTETINLTVLPRIADHITKGSAGSTASAYANWFTAVQEPVL